MAKLQIKFENQVKCLFSSSILLVRNSKENMLRKRQNRIRHVWGGGLLKELLNRFPLFLCTSCITLSFAFHHFCDPSYIHPNCLWFPLFTLFHFYSAEIYFTYTNYCLCMFFVNYRFSILLSSCFLSPHPIHASSLLSSKNVNHWKM